MRSLTERPSLLKSAIAFAAMAAFTASLSAALPAFVAVGDDGVLLASNDGNSWSSVNSGTLKRLRGVAVRAGVAVVVGESGTILRGTNGVDWNQVTSGVTASLRGVCAAPGGFVAVGGGGSGLILKSSDGSTWSTETIPVLPKLRSVAASDDALVAVGDQGTVMVKGRDQVWRQVNFVSQDRLEYVVWTGTHYWIFTASGKLFSSSNLKSWQSDKIRPLALLEGMAWNEKTLVAVGTAGQIQVTKDGREWKTVTSGTAAGLHGVAWTGDPRRARSLPESVKDLD